MTSPPPKTINIEVPAGLTELLNEFTVRVLRAHPENLLKFAKNYFDERYKNASVLSEEDLADIPQPFRNNQRRKSIAAERYDPSQDSEPAQNVFYPKTEAQKAKLNLAVKSIFLFSALEPAQISLVIDAMKEKAVNAGDVIIKEGDEQADWFYVVDKGTYEINIKGSVVHTYVDEGSFGELALMYNTPRAATITARTNGVLWALDRISFRRIVLRSAFQKRQVYEEFLNAVPILSSLDKYERMQVCDALKPMRFEKDDLIIKRGDNADNMYFVEEGEVKVMRTNDAGHTKEVSRIQRGGYFGELGLISKKPRAADVISTGNTQCAALDVDAFERLLGPCVEVMKRNMASYDIDMNKAFNEGII